MENRIGIRSIRLGLVLIAIVGTAVSGIACQSEVHGLSPRFELDSLIETYPLVVEGTVVGQVSDANTVEDRERRLTIPYTAYQLSVDNYLSGSETGTIQVTIPDDSGVRLESGGRYVIFLDAQPIADGGVWGGHRYLSNPQRVWSVDGDTITPFSHGVSAHLSPISRAALIGAIAARRGS